MYTLRKIVDKVQLNKSIGGEYHFTHRLENYDEFCRLFEIQFGESHAVDKDNKFCDSCYGFITCNGGSEIIPLYKKQKNYIMTENGKTFSNLTYK